MFSIWLCSFQSTSGFAFLRSLKTIQVQEEEQSLDHLAMDFFFLYQLALIHTVSCVSTWNESPSFLFDSLPRKEVIQPHLPVRLPCYDFTPLTLHTFGASPLGGWAGDFGCRRLGWCDGRCVQGPGTYSPRHADPRLLATPASWRRVAASNPNWDRLCGIRSPSRGGSPLYRPL